MSAVVSIDRGCMRIKVRDRVVRRILDGTYPPGFRLKELALAREFNVSQAPVREALRELATLGLVTSEHYRGTRVRAVDVDEMREAYELRALIEARAAELALPASEALLAALENDVADMRAGLEADDRDRLAESALRFHRRLTEASGNRSFVQAWDSFNWDVRARIVLQRIVQGGRELLPTMDQHLAIVERMRAGDGPGANQAVRRCFDIFVSQLLATASPYS